MNAQRTIEILTACGFTVEVIPPDPELVEFGDKTKYIVRRDSYEDIFKDNEKGLFEFSAIKVIDNFARDTFERGSDHGSSYL